MLHLFTHSLVLRSCDLLTAVHKRPLLVVVRLFHITVMALQRLGGILLLCTSGMRAMRATEARHQWQ